MHLSHPLAHRFNAILSTLDADSAISVASQHEGEGAFDYLARRVSELQFHAKTLPISSRLLLMPVVGCNLGEYAAGTTHWQSVAQLLSGELDAWLAGAGWKCLFDGVHLYDQVSKWGPLVQQSYLQRTVPGNQKNVTVRFSKDSPHSFDSVMANEIPGLGFVALTSTSVGSNAPVPQGRQALDQRLQQVVSLAMQTDKANPVYALAPSSVSDAIVSGIHLWLSVLSSTCKVQAWRTVLKPSIGIRGADQVIVQMAAGHRGEDADPPMVCEFSLRKHQIGNDGVQAVLAALNDIVPISNLPGATAN